LYKTIFLILFSVIFTQELEVDGDLKLQGNLVFPDETSMNTSAKGLPPGVIMPYAGIEAPEGWVLCAGQEVSRTEFSALYETIGELYGGGDGETTFNLPDLRGRMPLGRDNMAGTSADRVVNEAADNLGADAGEENHVLTVNELASHNHSYNPSAGNSGYSGAGIQTSGSNWPGGGSVGSNGGNQPHNNMPPYLTLNYIIKY
jgi:microcystin-dependent protein